MELTTYKGVSQYGSLVLNFNLVTMLAKLVSFMLFQQPLDVVVSNSLVRIKTT